MAGGSETLPCRRDAIQWSWGRRACGNRVAGTCNVPLRQTGRPSPARADAEVRPCILLRMDEIARMDGVDRMDSKAALPRRMEGVQ